MMTTINRALFFFFRYIILTFDSMEWVRGETIGYGSFSTVTLATPTDNDSGEFPPLMAVKSSDSYARQREIGFG